MPLPEGKRRAFERCQQDTGWGRVFVHIIPFYDIYYALSRRIITPSIFNFGLSVCSTFLYGGMVIIFTPVTQDMTIRQAGEKVEETLENDPFVKIMPFFMSIIGTKYGIDRARKSAHMDLKAED